VPLSAAVLHQGFPITEVELSNKDVWVTNGHDILAGRLNRQIEELDASVAAATPALDVVQNGNAVFLFDTTANSLERVDPAFTRLSDRVDLPRNAVVRLGGTTLAILDQASGDLWVVDIAASLDFDPLDTPDLELGAGAQVAVSPDGTVFATSARDQKLYTIATAGAKPSSRDVAFSKEHQLTAVGENPVILDTAENVVVREDGSTVELGSDRGLKLQQSSADNGTVIVATANTLLRVPLGNGGVEVAATTIASGETDGSTIASPVWLNGCAHGAWAGVQEYMLWCEGQASGLSGIQQPTAGDRLEFRVNKSVIALNNLSNGDVWLVDNEMRLVENWDEVTPPLEAETDDGDEKSSTQSFEDTLSERTDQNRPPIANPDEFGARVGRTTILPVIENDSDPDGDVLVVSAVNGIDASKGTLDLIDGGRALQFTPAVGVSNASFRYTIADGRGGVAETTAQVRVVPAGQNAAPVEKRVTAVSVEVGGSLTHSVLTDWIDPDGDDLTLVGATAASGDEVRYTPDGLVTFQSKTAELGDKEVQLTVSDGISTATGTFIVTIAAPGTLSPVGTPDFAEAFVNETVSVSPLLNDVSPSTAALELLGIDEIPENLAVTPRLTKGTITFSSPIAGTYYLIYSLGAGAQTSIGLIRVDIKPDPESPLAPIAVKDTAYLRPGEPTIIKVLANDVSPTGLVLAVQSHDTSTTDGALSVEVLNNTVIRVTSSAALTTQTQFTYTISDGTRTALAGVTIVPIAPIVYRQPPVALDDAVRVRVGDFVSVDVLANDYHPDDAQILLQPELADTLFQGAGLAFVNDQKVRYQAPDEAGSYSVIYRIADQYGESATATVAFTVVDRDEKNNQPPVPEVQTARVFAGSSVKITIPLDEIDPDGDSVVMTAISASPVMGKLGDLTPNSVLYTASVGAAGTDTFTYEVQDTFGSKATGVIKIGVIPLPPVSDPPNAVDDAVEIKPGRTASVAVVANDSDPSGYLLSVAPALVEVDPGIKAKVDNDKVVINAPAKEGTFSIRYSIDNGHGGVDSAFIQVRVTADARPVFPTALDYYVPLNDVIDGEGTVVVPLAKQIANPAGVDGELLIALDGPNAELGEVDQEAQTITVRASDLRTAIAYTVTNPDDELSATAFLIVPAVPSERDEPPYLDPDFPTPTIDMNAEGEWELKDFVIVPSGNKAIITDKATLGATNGKAVWVDKDTVRFEPALDFRGPASLSFEVTDGADKDDINGRKAIITLPINVGNPDFTDSAPTFTKQNVTIEPEGKDLAIDLRASTSHPNPALIPSFRYEGLAGGTDDVEGRIEGGELIVSSPFGTHSGIKVTFDFTVEFEEFSIPGSVTVTTVASTKPLAQAVQDDDKGKRGAAQPEYNVLDNDYNPFAADGKVLTVVDASIENQAASGASLSWDPDGGVRVTPGPSFIGNISVVYTIEDATTDITRQVQGRYVLNVRDAPDKITPAPLATPGDLQATVTWVTPATNGEPISGYTVTWLPPHGPGGGTVSLPSSAASYTATGLTNGTDYNFRVSATNLIGTSTYSDWSLPTRPKGKATAPTSTVLTASTDGSGVLSMSWGGAGANGGSITGYDWTVYQGATAVDSGHSAGTSATSTALIVGQAYTFAVLADATGGNSDPSVASAAATPKPGKPTVVLTAPGAAGNYALSASYTAAAAHGVAPAAVTYSWTLTPGSSTGTQAAPYSWSTTGGANTTYTLTVTASVNGVTNSASDPATTPGVPVPTWSATASNSCPKEANGSSGSTAQSPCAMAKVNGAVTLYCRVQWGTFTWYLFTNGSQYPTTNYILRDFTLTFPNSSRPANC
jgi:hypothetical protein